MRDILPFIEDALAESRRFAWARVVETWGSAPRRPGAAMVVESPSAYAGSVSGGCVEEAVIDECLASLVSGQSQLVTYGISDTEAWTAGLSCGGNVRILVEPFPGCSVDPAIRETGRRLLAEVRAGRPATLVTPLSAQGGSPTVLDGEGSVLSGPAAEIPAGLLRPTILEDTPSTRFVHPFPRRDRLVILGGSEIAVRLIPLAHEAEFETSLIDPRGVLADGRSYIRHPEHTYREDPSGVLRRMGIDDSVYAVLLTHDPSIDDPALHLLLRSPARYIGALGGRKTQEARRSRMAAAGFSKAEIDRIDGPVGLPIGAETPTEIAISIVAKLVAVRRGR